MSSLTSIGAYGRQSAGLMADVEIEEEPTLLNGDKEQRRWIAALRSANDVIRLENHTPDLSTWLVKVLLLIAETPAQPLSWIQRESGLTTSGTQRVLLALGPVDRFGKPGMGLVEDLTDPQSGHRKIYFLSEQG